MLQISTIAIKVKVCLHPDVAFWLLKSEEILKDSINCKHLHCTLQHNFAISKVISSITFRMTMAKTDHPVKEAATTQSHV